MHLCSLSRLSGTIETPRSDEHVVKVSQMLEMSRKTTPECPCLLCLICKARVPGVNSPGKSGETEKFRVGFPILTDKFLEMLEKQFGDQRLGC